MKKWVVAIRTDDAFDEEAVQQMLDATFSNTEGVSGANVVSEYELEGDEV